MSERSIWWLGSGAAAVLLALIVGLLVWRFEDSRGLAHSAETSQIGAARIGLSRLPQVSTGDLVAEEALFFDPSPMFLPSEWSVNQKALPTSVLRDPGQMFQDFEARLVFKRDTLALTMPEADPVIAKPIDVLSSTEEMVKNSGLGEKDVAVPTLQARNGYIEVVSVSSGRMILQESLEIAGLPNDLWRPMELSGAINAAGVVGQWSVVSGAGEIEVDQRIRRYVADSLHLGQRLVPGFYRIYIGP